MLRFFFSIGGNGLRYGKCGNRLLFNCLQVQKLRFQMFQRPPNPALWLGAVMHRLFFRLVVKYSFLDFFLKRFVSEYSQFQIIR